MKKLALVEKVNGKFYESRRATQPKGAWYTCDWENFCRFNSVEALEKRVNAGVEKMNALVTAILSANGWKEEAVRRAGELQEVLKTFRFDPSNPTLSSARMYQLETYANRMWFLESAEVRGSLPVEAQWIATQKKEPATKQEQTPKKAPAKKKEPAARKTTTKKDAAADNQMEAALSAVLQGMTQMLQQNQQILEILAAQKK